MVIETREDAVKFVMETTTDLKVWRPERVKYVQRDIEKKYDYITEHYCDDKGKAPAPREIAGMLVRWSIDDQFDMPRFISQEDIEALVKALMKMADGGAEDIDELIGKSFKINHVTATEVDEFFRSGELPKKCRECSEDDCMMRSGSVDDVKAEIARNLH
jgi:hypothetical protein